MKKIYLIHCWDGTPEDGWYPWLKKELEKENIEVNILTMPDTANPTIEKWTKKVSDTVENLDENTYFIGHSIGCQTILRYLEKQNKKVGGMLLIAPWLDLLPEAIEDEDSYNTAYPWINTPIDFEKVKQATNNINCIFSDDDYFVSMDQKQAFKDKLDAKTTLVHQKGHISQDDGIYELKEILDITKNMLDIGVEI